MTVDACPGCGYPMIGTGLCAYCQPALAVEPVTTTATDSLRPEPAVPLHEAVG